MVYFNQLTCYERKSGGRIIFLFLYSFIQCCPCLFTIFRQPKFAFPQKNKCNIKSGRGWAPSLRKKTDVEFSLAQ
jgi:hypothetical protein